ncbi:hypothetical protein D3C72_1189580 [compost metagenome]
MERSIDSPSPAVSSLAVPLQDGEGALRLVLTVIGSTGGIDVDWSGPVATALRDAARDIGTTIAAAFAATIDKAPA